MKFANFFKRYIGWDAVEILIIGIIMFWLFLGGGLKDMFRVHADMSAFEGVDWSYCSYEVQKGDQLYDLCRKCLAPDSDISYKELSKWVRVLNNTESPYLYTGKVMKFPYMKGSEMARMQESAE